MPWELGNQLSKICADHEKHLKSINVQPELKKEFLRVLRSKNKEEVKEEEVKILAN